MHRKIGGKDNVKKLYLIQAAAYGRVPLEQQPGVTTRADSAVQKIGVM